MATSSSEPLSPPQSPPGSDNPSSPGENAVVEKDFAERSFAKAPSPVQPPRLPALRTTSESMTASTTLSSSAPNPLGSINAARRPPPPSSTNSSLRAGALPSDMAAKMKAFHMSRRGAPPATNTPGQSPIQGGPMAGGALVSGMPTPITPIGGMGGSLVGSGTGFKLPPSTRPSVVPANSAPAIPGVRMTPKMGGGLAAKRGLNRGMKLSDANGPSPTSLVNGNTGENGSVEEKPKQPESMFNKYADYVDTASGTLRFKGKATIHGSGVDFSSGSSFSISLDEVDTIDELGKGNYGTVYQVKHSRPRIRRPGLGLAGNKAPTAIPSASPTDFSSPESPQAKSQRNTTGLVMAMKEIRLELDDAKFAAIIMELDVLHRCVSPFIVDFYGAFFQEGAVYICMEFMDGGSIDKLYGDGIPENVLRKIALSTVMGLKSLKDDHNIIHRDVKPTNILVNSRGQVKICDFGVSGNLVASIAKTNIGCQSYMAPERIASGGVAQAGANPGGGTYSVQSDIWSLGLTIIECAMGRYPYPPETYNNIFSQLSVSFLPAIRSYMKRTFISTIFMADYPLGHR